VPAVRRAAGLPLDPPARPALALAVGATPGVSTTGRLRATRGRLTAGGEAPRVPAGRSCSASSRRGPSAQAPAPRRSPCVSDIRSPRH
jgi:nucleoid-associated protein YgaU